MKRQMADKMKANIQKYMNPMERKQRALANMVMAPATRKNLESPMVKIEMKMTAGQTPVLDDIHNLLDDA